MGWGPLHDERDGGFFRYARRARLGSAERREAARRQRGAARSLRRCRRDARSSARYAERAEDVLRYVQTWLADPVDGGWAGSQRADPAYYAAAGRRRLDAGRRAADRSHALHRLERGDGVGGAQGRTRAERAVALGVRHPLARTDRRCSATSPAAGWRITTTARPQVRGLLDDQIAMAAAQLDAFEATGNIVYRNAGRGAGAPRGRTDVGRVDGGGFFDRTADPAADVGSAAASGCKPFAANCAAARLLRPAGAHLRQQAALSRDWPNATLVGDRRRAPPARGRWPPTTCSRSGPPAE